MTLFWASIKIESISVMKLIIIIIIIIYLL